MFDWSKFKKTKGAVKLHLILDHSGYLPECAYISGDKVHKVNILRKLQFFHDAIVVMERECVDYELFGRWSTEGVLFVTRLWDNASYQVIKTIFTRKQELC